MPRSRQRLKEAEKLGNEAEEHLTRHERLAGGVTLLLIAIALGAISALTKRKVFWGVSLLFGVAGVCLLVFGKFFAVVLAHPG